jgi:inner membrane protein
MHRSGHFGVSLIWAAILLLLLPPQWSIPVAAVMIGTEFLPDLDFRVSLLDHRGYSHTVWAGLLVGSIFGITAAVFTSTIGAELAALVPIIDTINPLRPFAIVATGTLLGFLAHFTGDVITVGQGYYGVQPFAPLSQWESSIQLCRADSTVGNGLLLAAGWVALAGSTYLRLHFAGLEVI